MTEESLPPAQQTRRFGTYTTYREIARGGQGAVLEARSDQSGERVALKVLIHPSVNSRKRFEQEAQVLLRLSHPNLIQVRDLGEKNGFPYLAMEYVDGQDLQDIVDGRGVPEPSWSAEVMAVIADALHYCHGQGIVHRDVKPANVLIERGTRRAVLVDFGLVKRDTETMRLSAIDDGGGPFSRSGELRGTPCFMSPEQVRPSHFGPVTPATDVYALGATLYYLLTGVTPIEEGPLSMVLVNVVDTPPRDPRKLNPEVPDWLAELCLRCLAKQPSDRPRSAAAVAEALRTPIERPARRGGLPHIMMGAAAVVGLVLGLVAGVAAGRGPTPEALPPLPPVVVTATPAPVPTPAVTDVAPVGTTTTVAELIRRGRELMKRAKHEEAIPLFNLALERAPEGSLLWRNALRQRGWSSYRLGRIAEGIADYTRVIAVKPLGSFYVDRARMRAALKDPGGALKDYDQAVILNPKMAHRWRSRGFHRRTMGDEEGAIEDFTRAIDLEPGNASSWSARGWAKINAGLYREALVDYDQSLILEASNVHRVARAIAYRWVGDLERAQADLDWVIDRNKGYLSRALAYRAMLHLVRKDMKLALIDAERAVQEGPKDQVAWRYLGDTRRLRGEDEQALAAYAKALELQPGYTSAIAGRALVRLRQGHRRVAKTDLELALATMPAWEWNYPQVKQVFEGLK